MSCVLRWVALSWLRLGAWEEGGGVQMLPSGGAGLQHTSAIESGILKPAEAAADAGIGCWLPWLSLNVHE